MDLSIAIRVKDDVRIKECIDSIDEEVETIVVLNTPTNEVIEIVKKLDVKTAYMDNNNLAKAHNAGIEISSNEKVLLMDADCTFDKGTIKKIYQGLEMNPLSKGSVKFNYSSLTSKIVALSREYHVTDIANAYAPPLGINKAIKNDLGGYFFDEDLFWTEDHEFDQRVRKNNIPISFIPEATIQHAEQSLMNDLRSSFNYGAGYFEGIKKEATEPSFMYGGNKSMIKSLGYDCLRVAALPYLFTDVIKKKGVMPAAFMTVWLATFSGGYYSQGFFNVLGKEK